MKRCMIFIAMLLVTLPVIAGTMYEWRDPTSGKLMLGDKPPTGGIQYWPEGQGPVPSEKTQKRQAITGKWYEGGTLHKSTVMVWLKSDETNKLATCADWVINHKKVKSIVVKNQNIDSLKPFAYELCECMNKSVSGKASQSQQTSEIAAACMILMWGNP